MSTRQKMVRRAVLERNTASGLDPYGQPIPPLWTPLAEPIPCWVYSRAKRQAVDREGIVIVEDIRALFPKAADVRQGDRVQVLTDRLGIIVWNGPMEIRVIQPRPDHVEAQLVRLE